MHLSCDAIPKILRLLRFLSYLLFWFVSFFHRRVVLNCSHSCFCAPFSLSPWYLQFRKVCIHRWEKSQREKEKRKNVHGPCFEEPWISSYFRSVWTSTQLSAIDPFLIKTICKWKTWRKAEWKRKNKTCLKNMKKNQKIKYHGSKKHGTVEWSHGEKEKKQCDLT